MNGVFAIRYEPGNQGDATPARLRQHLVIHVDGEPLRVRHFHNTEAIVQPLREHEVLMKEYERAALRKAEGGFTIRAVGFEAVSALHVLVRETGLVAVLVKFCRLNAVSNSDRKS